MALKSNVHAYWNEKLMLEFNSVLYLLPLKKTQKYNSYLQVKYVDITSVIISLANSWIRFEYLFFF